MLHWRVYAIWSLQKKIEKRKPKLLEMIFCITLFGGKTENGVIGSDTTDESDNLDWVRVLDRGGIFHCRMEFIKFLCAMVVVVNAEMILGNEAAMKAGFKEKLAFEVHQDEDVLFWWSNLCDVECCKALVHYVVDRNSRFCLCSKVDGGIYKEGGKRNHCGTKSLRVLALWK